MYQRILVAIDGSATSERGLDQAVALARLTGGAIRLVNVVDELVFATGFETGGTYVNTVLPALRQTSERILASGKERAIAPGVAVETLSVECFARRISAVIVEQAIEWKADLIVLGTQGRRGINRLMLGSDAEQVLRIAPVPVLLVRSTDAADGAAADAAPTGVSASGRSAVANVKAGLAAKA